MSTPTGMDATATSVDSAPRESRACRVLRWVLRLVLAVVFAGAGLAKLAGDPAMVEMFTDIGTGQWLRTVVGALELAGALGLLVPRLARLAATGLAAVMVGAVVANPTVLDASPALPLVLLVLTVGVVLLERARPA